MATATGHAVGSTDRSAATLRSTGGRVLFGIERFRLSFDEITGASAVLVVDGEIAGTDDVSPFEFELDTTRLTNRRHEAVARVTSGAGVTLSNRVSFRTDNELSSSRRVDVDLASGRLDRDAGYRLGMWSVLRTDLLPRRYRSEVDDDREAFQLVVHFARLRRFASPKTRALVERTLRGPEDAAPRGWNRPQVARPQKDPARLSYSTGEGHFRISWTDISEDPYDGISDYDMRGPGEAGGPNGIPDLIDDIAFNLEVGWDAYTSMGYRPPPTPVQVVIDDPPGSSPGFASPFDHHITLHRDEPGTYLPRHELFHVFQYQYVDGNDLTLKLPSMWWLEATADWAAHQSNPGPSHCEFACAFVMRGNNEYADHLAYFLGEPDETITGYLPGSSRPYGAFILAEFLEERHGVTFVRKSWEEMDDGTAADQAIEDVLESDALDDSWEDMLPEFWRSAYFLDLADPDTAVWRDVLGFSTQGTAGDATAGPRPLRQTTVMAPFTQYSAGIGVSRGGAAFSEFVPPDDSGTLRVEISDVDGWMFAEVGLQMVGVDSEGDILRQCGAMQYPTAELDELAFEIDVSPQCDFYTLMTIETNPESLETGRDVAWRAVFTPTYENMVQGDRTVGHWRLGEASGTELRDSSVNAIHGTYGTGVQLGRPGAIRGPNTAVRFPSGATVAHIPYSAAMGTPQVTGEAWVRTSLNDSNERWAVHRIGTFSLGLRNGTVRSYLITNSGGADQAHLLTNSRVISDGRWHHVAVTYDGSIGKLYVDGQVEPSGIVQVGGRAGRGIDKPTLIGGSTNGAGPFVGDIDEVALYGYALSDQEIQRRLSHRRTSQPTCTGNTPYSTAVCADRPTGFWRFNQAAGPVVPDYVGVQPGDATTGVTFGKRGAVDSDANLAIGTTKAHVVVPEEPYGAYSTSNLTGEAWVRTTRDASGQRWAVHREGAFSLGVSNGKAVSYLIVDTGTGPQARLLTNTRLIADGAWHHLAVTYDGSVGKLYVDGDVQAEGTVTIQGRVPQGVPKGVWIGVDTSGAGRFPGDVDEVAIYDHALGSDRIQARLPHVQSTTPPCNGTSAYTNLICADRPTGFWRLNESAGPTVSDYVGLRAGEATNGVAFGRPGAVGSDSNTAIGTANAHVVVPEEPYGTYSTDSLTGEAWVRTTRDESGERWAVHREGAYSLGVSNGRAVSYLIVDSGSGPVARYLTNSRSIADGAWHHLAVTYNGSVGKLYVDGEVQLQGTVNVEGRVPQGVLKGIWIGVDTTGSGRFIGDVDEVAIYDHALGAARLGERLQYRRP